VVGTDFVIGFGAKGLAYRLHPVQAHVPSEACGAHATTHWGGDVVVPACTQIASTARTELCAGVWPAAPHTESNHDSRKGFRIVDGHTARPQGPGLGVNPDPGMLGDPLASF
jgi:hypothetical protein